MILPVNQLTIAQLLSDRFDYEYFHDEGVLVVIDLERNEMYKVPVDSDDIKLHVNDGEYNTYHDGWNYALQEPSERRVHYSEIELEQDDYKRYGAANADKWGEAIALEI